MPRHSSAAEQAGHRRGNRKYGAKYLLSSDKATSGEEAVEQVASMERNPVHAVPRPLSPGARAALPIRQHSRAMPECHDSFLMHNARDGGNGGRQGLTRSESKDERRLSRRISVDSKLKNRIIEEAVKKARERQILKLQEYSSSKAHGAKVERKDTAQYCRRRDSSRYENTRCENPRRENSRCESRGASHSVLDRRDTNVKYPVRSQDVRDGSGREQETSRRDRTPDDIQEWLKWRCYLNHQLSMHILRGSERSDSIDIMSMPEKLDNDIRCAIWSQAQQEIPKTSLNSTAYLVYGIPRARLKPKAFELHTAHYAVPSKSKHLQRNNSRHGELEREHSHTSPYLPPTDFVNNYRRNNSEHGLQSASQHLQRDGVIQTQGHTSSVGHANSDLPITHSNSTQPVSSTNGNLPSSPTNGNRNLVSPRGRCHTPSIQKQMYKHLARRDSHKQAIMTNSEIVARAKNLKRIENAGVVPPSTASNGSVVPPKSPPNNAPQVGGEPLKSPSNSAPHAGVAPPNSPPNRASCVTPSSPTANTVYAQLQHVTQDKQGSAVGQAERQYTPSKCYASGAKYAAAGLGRKDSRQPYPGDTLRPISPSRREASQLRPISPTSREVGQLTGASAAGLDVKCHTGLNRENSVWRDPRVQSPIASPVNQSGPSNLREMYKRPSSTLQHMESTNSSQRPTSPLSRSSFRPVSPIQTDVPVTQQYAHCAKRTIHAKQPKSPSFQRGAESLQYKFMVPEGAFHERRYHNVLPREQQVPVPCYIPPPPPPPLPPKTFSKNTSGR